MTEIVIIIQARCGSSRLPRKCFLELNGVPILQHVYERCMEFKYNSKVIVATTTSSSDDEIELFCRDKKYHCYRGDRNDLINRFYYLAKLVEPETIIRVTADCPYIDPNIMNKMFNQFRRERLDYLYNTDEDDQNKIYPEGSDIEIFNMNVLEYIMTNEKTNREHASGCVRLDPAYKERFNIGMYENNFKTSLKLKNNFNGIHLSIDTQAQYELAKFIFWNMPRNFTYENVLEFLDIHYDTYQHLLQRGKERTRIGADLYKRAKEIIPGGTQLLSKRPEMFLPDEYPSYYERVDGIVVTDIDGIKRTDMGINGIGSCILGANDPDVNRSVISVIEKGSMCTLGHPSEVALTERLLELHPWAKMARYTRSGGEANCVAIRIARAYASTHNTTHSHSSGKSKIAFCGYHGWSDWYLATNINSSGNLDKHLLSGLSSEGVPPELEGTIFPFTYNKVEELENILSHREDIGIIIMEPMRNIKPENNFLQRVRELATKYGCILIFDEITSAFRTTNGGLHMTLGVEPDICTFSKTISNGFPLACVIGRREIMEKAQDTFVSSTYWTESVGFVAGLATINKFVECKVAEHIKEHGEYFQSRLKELATTSGMKINVSGTPGITSFSFGYENPLAIKTLYNQFMLDNGYLATWSLYLTFCHTKAIIDKYLVMIEKFIATYRADIESNVLTNVTRHLRGGIAHAGFQRLN